MTEAVGLLVSIIQLADASHQAIRFIEKVKDGPKERREIQHEIGMLSVLLIRFRSRVEEAEENGYTNRRWSRNAPEFAAMLSSMTSPLVGLSERIRTSHNNRHSRMKDAIKWPYSEEKSREILDRIHRLVDKIHLAISEESNELLKDISSSLHAERKSDRRKAIMGWLPTLGFAAKQEEFYRSAVTGTGQWFLSSKEFQDWQNRRSQKLWLPGIPGAGKTIMASIIVNHLQQSCLPDGKQAVIMIYFDYAIRDRLTLPFIYGDLLSQLLQVSPEIPREIEDWYLRDHETSAHQDALLRALSTAIAKFEKLYIVIDALDEWDLDSKALLDRLSQLGQSINLLVVSRWDASKDNDIETWPRRVISAASVDVQAFVRNEIASNQTLKTVTKTDPELAEIIVSTIAKKAEKMFLLARLNVDALKNQIRKKDIKAQLQALPENLATTYDEAILRIRSQGNPLSSLATQVLTWLLFVRRPLLLDELHHALGVDLGDTEFDEDNLISDPKYLSSCCAGLVVVDDTQTVRLVHYTTEEYFRKHPEALLPEPNAMIAGICLTYLNLTNLIEAISMDQHRSTFRKFPLIAYAARYWGYHLSGTPEKDPNLRALARSFLQQASTLFSLVDAFGEETLPYGENRFSRWQMLNSSQGLHIASGLGLSQVVKELLRLGQDPNSIDDRGLSALHFAAAHGRLDTTRLLLDNGANPNQRKGEHGEMPLQTAIVYGRKEIAVLLMDRARDLKFMLDPPNQHGSIMEAIVHDQMQIFEIVLDRGADIYHRDRNQNSILRACHKNRAEYLRILLDHGAHLEEFDRDHAIELSLYNNTPECLKLLLTSDIDINKPVKSNTGMPDGFTPLDLALVRGDPCIIGPLLEAGAHNTLMEYYEQQPLISRHNHQKWFGKLQALCTESPRFQPIGTQEMTYALRWK